MTHKDKPPEDVPLYWFASMQGALDEGKLHVAAIAVTQLARLGVTVTDVRLPTAYGDLIESIPDPDTVRALLAQSVRRSELLRSLLRTSKRKAAFDRPRGNPPATLPPDPVR